MTGGGEADRDIEALARELAGLRETLGDAYWSDERVRALQTRLRAGLGRYAAWSGDTLPPNQRARAGASYEARFARLLWPY